MHVNPLGVPLCKDPVVDVLTSSKGESGLYIASIQIHLVSWCEDGCRHMMLVVIVFHVLLGFCQGRFCFRKGLFHSLLELINQLTPCMKGFGVVQSPCGDVGLCPA